MVEPMTPTTSNPVPPVAFLVPPIGLVHVAGGRRRGAPRYFVPRKGATLELFQPYGAGLRGLYQGQELWVITYHAAPERHAGGPASGVFATLDLERPNPIEFLRARIVEVDAEAGRLQVTGLDSEDGVPILDLRPATMPHQRLARPDEAKGQP